MSTITFDTHPDRYRHWGLEIDGAVATLSMAVRENEPLCPGYVLKLNSYDLGVDIELADAVQRWINYWFAYSLDLFGSEVSSNAADYFAAGLKGRWKEAEVYKDHDCLEAVRIIPQISDGRLVDVEVPLRNAMNEELRDAYVTDCHKALKRWNRSLEQEGVSFRLTLPNTRFYRRQGLCANHHFDPSGKLIDEETWQANRDRWLPSESDRDYVQSLMEPVLDRGKMAHWIAAPKKGIHGQPIDYEYVRK
jgi:benzoyl-CoA 2,3-dioxygenase component B